MQDNIRSCKTEMAFRGNFRNLLGEVIFGPGEFRSGAILVIENKEGSLDVWNI